MAKENKKRNLRWLQMHDRKKNPMSYAEIAEKEGKDRSTVVKVIVRMRQKRTKD